MTTNTEKALERFRELNKTIKSYHEALGVLYWDLRTGAPRKGVASRSEAIGVLSSEAFRLTTSDEMGDLLARLSEQETLGSLDEINRRLVTESKKDYDKSKKNPGQAE